MFESAKLKIERANHHIDDFERQFARFIETNPHSLSLQNNSDTGQVMLGIRFKEKTPEGLALIIGDAVHNLRCALDHMVWDMVGRDRGTQDRRLKLPAGADRVSFEAFCKGIKTPSQRIIAALLTLEVFPGGKGEALYQLHLLDNADKHTVVMPTVRASRISKFKIMRPDGVPMATVTNVAFAGGDGYFANITNVAPGMSVELDNDSKVTPDIFLGDIQGVPRQPVIPLLRQLSHATADTLDIVAAATV